MFFIFIMACKKYNFAYMINTYANLTLTLYPLNTFQIIKLEEQYINYYTIFLKAIIIMRKYRNKKKGG